MSLWHTRYTQDMAVDLWNHYWVCHGCPHPIPALLREFIAIPQNSCLGSADFLIRKGWSESSSWLGSQPQPFSCSLSVLQTQPSCALTLAEDVRYQYSNSLNLILSLKDLFHQKKLLPEWSWQISVPAPAWDVLEAEEMHVPVLHLVFFVLLAVIVPKLLLPKASTPASLHAWENFLLPPFFFWAAS